MNDFVELKTCYILHKNYNIMFKKKEKLHKKNLNIIKELTFFTTLIHHPFISVVKNEMSIGSVYFNINDTNIGSIKGMLCRQYEFFEFNSDLSEELKDELRPIILKWVEESNEYYKKKKQEQEKQRELEINKSNEDLLQYIKSL